MEEWCPPRGLPESYENSSSGVRPSNRPGLERDLVCLRGFTRSPSEWKGGGPVRDLSVLEPEDDLWDPASVSGISNERLAEKMGQTSLSLIAYSRRRTSKVGALKLSQQIGILLWLNQKELISTRGEERLLFLQSKAPWGAMDAALQFAQRLDMDEKLQLDFYHHMVVQNCHPSSKRLRAFRARRIGIGYRDKGTLPSPSAGARRGAQADAWVLRDDLGSELQTFLDSHSDLSEEEWVDLPELARILRSGLAPEVLRSLLGL